MTISYRSEDLPTNLILICPALGNRNDRAVSYYDVPAHVIVAVPPCATAGLAKTSPPT